MARNRIVDDKNLCPKCLSPTEMLQKKKDNLWRCINSLCRLSRDGNGYMIGEKRIPAEKVLFIVDEDIFEVPRRGLVEFKKEAKRYLK
ncbi:hypothetical protein [Methanobacterium spitsbergense]|uniref:Uncharacterized protein n=1 Tax=Methanobacterium spitsbergense TaxID=2874285 RepID=A0A8T5V3W0_9EURY|nr:hypothetical protein [Methanobacterium spitsbergense]MBZ2166345.1 hypothetical protein [Methanobacterium spitsbergense]